MTSPAHPTGMTDPSAGMRPLRKRTTAAVVVLGVALAVAACSSGGSSSSSSGSAGGNTGGSHSITIKNFAFSPGTLTVTAGTTVTVTNDDQVAHTLTGKTGGFATGDIAAGQSKTFAVPKSPGTYSYFCSIHQYMSGTLVVSG
jgi:plastocyanin